MRFLIFNIVVVAALGYLVMDRPDVNLARAVPGDISIPAVAAPEAKPALQPQQHAPVKAEPTPVKAPAPVQAKPKALTEMPEMPPAKEVPVRVTHKAPRDVSASLKESAERIKAEIIERQNAPYPDESDEPKQTAAVQSDTFENAVSRRKSLLDLASDMELMFTEKMMR